MFKHISKFLMTLAVVASASLLISSCSDDEKNAVANSYTFDGTKVPVKASVFNYDAVPNQNANDETYHRHYLYLFGPGYTVNGSTVTGNGDYIELAISGPTANLDAGTYEFTGDEENPFPFELWDGRVYVGENEDEYIFGAATLTISKSGSKFTIILTATAYPPDPNAEWLPDLTAPGKTLTGKYIGSTINVLND